MQTRAKLNADLRKIDEYLQAISSISIADLSDADAAKFVSDVILDFFDDLREIRSLMEKGKL